MTQMIPTTHSEEVQTLIPTTPMLLDMILMILMDAKVQLDMILMLHQERVPTLTPTTPMLLDMIQTILLVARALLDMTQAIPMLLGTTQMIPTTHSEKVQTLTP